jgi:hypothetical protein
MDFKRLTGLQRETLQARAIARLENLSFFNRNTSRWQMLLGHTYLLLFQKIGYPDYMSIPVLSFPK